jgi:hypothetical protein
MTHSQAILDHLNAGNVLTPIAAHTKFHCFRLAARVSDLRAEGFNIVNEGDSKFAKYRLAEGISKAVPASSFTRQGVLLDAPTLAPNYDY